MTFLIILLVGVIGGYGYLHLYYRKMFYPTAPKIEIDKKHIACVGDSITFGMGVVSSKTNETWEYYLEKMLGSNYQVLNYGLSGRTLQDEGDMPYRKESFWSISREVRANIYLIMLGTNDSKPKNWNPEHFLLNLKSFVSDYIELGNQSQVCLLVPPASFKKKNGEVAGHIQPDVIEKQIRPLVMQFAKEQGIPCIDLYSFTATYPEWFTDGVHPNATGNKEIAGVIGMRLKELGIINF